IASVAVSDLRAVIRSPLRSKRAITSPVRARSKASGLTRIRVRLTAGAPVFLFGGRRFVGSAAGAFAAARRFRFGGGAFAFASVTGGGGARVGGLFFSRFPRRATLRRHFVELAIAFSFALGRSPASAPSTAAALGLAAAA